MYRTINELNIGDTLIFFGQDHLQNNAYFDGRSSPSASGSVADQNIIWRIVAKNQFAPNTVTLWSEKGLNYGNFHNNYNQTELFETWIGCTLQQACEALYESFPGSLKDIIVPVSLYNDDDMDYGPPERVSVFSVNEIYSRSQYERHFESRFIEGRYNDDVFVEGRNLFDPLFRANVRDYWTRTPSYDKIHRSTMAYAVGDKYVGTTPSTTSTRSSGIGQINQTSLCDFRPFINVSNDVYVTTEKYYGHCLMYGVSEDKLIGYININNEKKKLYGTRSYKEREWD